MTYEEPGVRDIQPYALCDRCGKRLANDFDIRAHRRGCPDADIAIVNEDREGEIFGALNTRLDAAYSEVSAWLNREVAQGHLNATEARDVVLASPDFSEYWREASRRSPEGEEDGSAEAEPESDSDRRRGRIVVAAIIPVCLAIAVAILAFWLMPRIGVVQGVIERTGPSGPAQASHLIVRTDDGDEAWVLRHAGELQPCGNGATAKKRVFGTIECSGAPGRATASIKADGLVAAGSVVVFNYDIGFPDTLGAGYSWDIHLPAELDYRVAPFNLTVTGQPEREPVLTARASKNGLRFTVEGGAEGLGWIDIKMFIEGDVPETLPNGTYTLWFGDSMEPNLATADIRVVTVVQN